MRFGQTAEEAEKQQSESGGGGTWFRYPKDGEQKFRVLQEPDQWIYFWEHFNPGGYPFPCTQDRKTCPGCISDNEKMKKANRKVAFNILQGEYVNAYKVPPLLADKLKLRYERLGTITDREYVVTRYKTAGDKTEYDVEGLTPEPIDASGLELHDIEPMLAAAFQEAWGDSGKAQATPATPKATVTLTTKPQEKDPPSEPVAEQTSLATGEGNTPKGDTEVSEDYLRSLDFADLRVFLTEQGVALPDEISTSSGAVDWLLANQ